MTAPILNATVEELIHEAQTRVQHRIILRRDHVAANHAFLENVRDSIAVLREAVEALNDANVKICNHPGKVVTPSTGYDPRDQVSIGGGWNCHDCGGSGQ